MKLIIPSKISLALVKDVALKNTQKQFTNKNVIIMAGILGISNFGYFTKITFVQCLFIKIPIPWNAPHSKNNHPAQCQIPPITKTMSKLIKVLTIPLLLPPRGI